MENKNNNIILKRLSNSRALEKLLQFCEGYSYPFERFIMPKRIYNLENDLRTRDYIFFDKKAYSIGKTMGYISQGYIVYFMWKLLS
jgi:hypothetical protein